MKKNNKFLTFLLLIIITGCSTSNPKYREGEPKQNFGYPADKEIEKSFYLLGDGGYAQPGGTSEGLIALKSYMDSVQVKDNYTMFLGIISIRTGCHMKKERTGNRQNTGWMPSWML
jgi:hypothetical protein